MEDDSSKADGLDGLSHEDLREIFEPDTDVQPTDKATEKEPSPDPRRKAAQRIADGQNVHESVRDLVMGEVKPLLERAEASQKEKGEAAAGADIVKERQHELHEMLENLGDELAGKSPQEVAAVMSSFLNIASQLSLKRTEGVICVKCRLGSFFQDVTPGTSVLPSMRQELNLIFSPEEVEAIRARLETLSDDNPMKPFFTMVLDQAFDVVQYNEMTGMILVEMTKHFLSKLKDHGLGNHPSVVDFNERHKRTVASLDRSLEELRDVEIVINNHLRNCPILEGFPRTLRILIHVRLGMLPTSLVPSLVATVRNSQGAYARARSVVAFDFNRLPSFQHGVRLRQSAILNLHKDVLKFTAEQFEAEYARVKEEFENLMSEIEASSETIDENSPEYAAMMRRKEILQKKIAEQRHKLDIVRSQERLVDVQHAQVQACIERYKQTDRLAQKVQELQDQPKIDPNKVREAQSGQGAKKKVSRMVTASSRIHR